jgi:RNA polymerase nonessential primary-like sigma factor
LTEEQERELGAAVQAGIRAAACLEENHSRASDDLERLERLVAAGEAAKQRMVEANLGLVGAIVNKLAQPGERSREDLFQEGVIGLMRAVDRFDPNKIGFRFATYAGLRIKTEIWRAKRTDQLIRLPRNVTDELSGLKKAESFLQSQGESSDDEAVADFLGVCVHWVRHLMMTSRELHQVTSLTRPLDNGDGAGDVVLGDVVGDPASLASYEKVETGLVIEGFINHLRQGLVLTRLEECVLRHRKVAWPPASLDDIADSWEVPRRDVQNAERTLRRKLNRAVSQGLIKPEDLTGGGRC